MSDFRYKILKSDGSLSEGVLTNQGSRRDAMRQLAIDGGRILSLEESADARQQKRARTQKTAVTKSRAPSENRLSSKQLIQFTEELSDMLAAGVQLDAALGSIAKRSETPVIRRVAEACYDKVRDGGSLAGSLRAASPSFDELYCNLVSAGEVSGALDEILRRQVRYLTTLADLRGKLVTAMIYPFFLIVSGIGVAAMFTFFLIPKLRLLVESTGGTLPPVARFMLGTGDFLKANWAWLFVALALLLVVLAALSRREAFKEFWDENRLRLPLFGKLQKTRFNVQFVETLSNLLGNGLPLVKALELVEGTTANRFIRQRIREITAKVSEGAVLNRSMEKTGIFEPGLIDMVRIGEDTGNLAQSMSKAGERLDREFARAIDRIGTLIQPAIILVMAVLVGAMAYMMISVIYETISVLRSR